MNICASLGELRERLVAGTKPESRHLSDQVLEPCCKVVTRSDPRTWTDSDTRQVFVRHETTQRKRVVCLDQFRDLVRSHTIP
jgi:hypothetical protein